MAIVRSKWPDINIPENLTLTEFVYQNFDEYGDRSAIVGVFFFSSSSSSSFVMRLLSAH